MNLLRQIASTGSVREACEKCGISYSKGWTIIHDCENELGYRIVERQPGGKYGGKAVISKHGEKLILLYEQLEREMNEIVQKKFDEIFLHGDWLKKSNLQGDMGDT